MSFCPISDGIYEFKIEVTNKCNVICHCQAQYISSKVRVLYSCTYMQFW